MQTSTLLLLAILMVLLTALPLVLAMALFGPVGGGA